MTQDVMSVTPETPLGEIAHFLERKRIKRVPVIDGAGRLVGIISRANLLQGLAVSKQLPAIQHSDEVLREKVFEALKAAPGFVSIGVNATVTNGIVELWGLVRTDDEDRAARVAAENVEGVRSVKSQPRSDAALRRIRLTGTPPVLNGGGKLVRTEVVTLAPGQTASRSSS